MTIAIRCSTLLANRGAENWSRNHGAVTLLGHVLVVTNGHGMTKAVTVKDQCCDNAVAKANNLRFCMRFTIICNYFKILFCDHQLVRRDQLPLTELCRGRSQTFGIFCTSTCSTSSVVPQSQLLERRHFYAAIQHNDYRKTPRLSERHRFLGGPQTTAIFCC